MKNRIKVLLALLMLCGTTQSVRAQDGGDMNNHLLRINDYVPAIPEAAGMQLYGNIPVSEYTGTPDISIPLYTLKCGRIELPITLSYHASGVKVAQEATWVGLGWNLLAGGCVNLNAVGKVDATSGTFATWAEWEKIKYHWKVQSADTLNYRSGTEELMNLWGNLMFDPNTSNTTNGIINEGLIGQGERDIFEVALPGGRSFKYFLHPKNQTPVIIGSRMNCKVWHSAEKVIITDEAGTSYAFRPYAFITSNAPLTYMLTSMTDVTGHTITLTYVTASCYSVPVMSEYYTVGTPPDNDYIKRDFTAGISQTCYLSKIETDTEEVIFEMGSREDRYPGTTGKLTNMKIKSKLDGKDVYFYQFNYDYFICPEQSVGGNYLSSDDYGSSSTIPTSVLRKRLKLLSVLRKNGTSQGEKHTFTYNEAVNLPYKTSFAIDYWGYYNGQQNTSTLTNRVHTLIPSLEGLTNVPLSGSTAVRNCSREYITANMLKKITYPTGGSVEFEFEPHTFVGDNRFISAEDLNKYDAQVKGVNTVNNNDLIVTPSATFTLPTTQVVTVDAQVNFPDYEVNQVIGSGTTLRKLGAGGSVIKSYKVTSQNTSGHVYHVNESFTLEVGDYVLTSTLSSAVTNQGYSTRNASSATLTYRGGGTAVNKDTLQKVGGGVRIKTITKKNNTGEVLERTGYLYESENHKTSGILMFSVKSYDDFNVRRGSYTTTPEGVIRPSTSYHTFRRFYAQAQTPPASAPNANPVGYSRVVKQRDFLDAGREELVFSNIAGQDYDATLAYMPANYNGRLLKKSIYDAGNILVWEDTYEYEIANKWQELTNIRVRDNYVGPVNCYSGSITYNENIGGQTVSFRNPLAYHGRFEITLYPHLTYDIRLKREVSTEYAHGVPVTQEKLYTYNSRNQIATCRTSTSRSGYVMESYAYAADVSSYKDEFKANNVLDAVQNYQRTSGGATLYLNNTYGDVFSKFTLQSSEEYSSLYPEKRTVSYRYDSKWNPVEVTTPDNMSVVYLWGYKYSLPIARLKGITYAEVVSRLGTTGLDALCSAGSPNTTALYALKTSFPECEVTTWLHNPSYGLKEIRKATGFKDFYLYNALGDLSDVQDHNQNPIASYFYQWSPDGTSQNYVRTHAMTAAAGSKYMASYDYYDGLGRLFQKVQKGITPTGSNLISLQEYDGAGRRSESWLPIVSSSVYMSPSAIKSAAPGNYSSDSRPYSKPVYSVSPLDRILKRYSPGAAWASKPVTMDYLANSSDVNCINYSVSSSGALVNNGTYAAGQLRVVKRIDEDQHVSYTFTDKQGHILLERQMQGSEQHDTYYVYNDLDNLCFVLQPMYQSVSNLDQYAFQYKYDNRNRCNWKKLPGASAVSYVYDEADNMIFSQDGKQYASKQWSFYLYDKFHRLAVQGVCSNTNTAAVSNVIVSCTRVNSNSGLGNSGYTSSFALVSPEVHRVNYYDDYAFRSLTGFDNAGFPAATIDAKGYVTGSVITVLGSSTKLYSANYYDFEGRITKTVQGNLLEGYDTTNTVYTFTGKPNTVTHTHTASGKTTRTEVYTYTYDHADRISKVRHSLGGTSITLYDATYDNFGRLLTKQYHGTSTNKLTYAYNLRSWLTGISGTCFTQNLYYNTGVGTAKYNGSISSMTWKSGNESTVRGYKFTYDGLDRVLNATYGETASISTNANRFSENVTGYDKNGNIKSLQRYGQTGASAYGLIDNLTFTLNGNQLSRVDDAVMASAYGGGFEFKDGVKQVGEYTYDANGNLTKDLNKGITDIQYNCLNLPSAVTFSDGSTITYVYAADGTKLRTVHKIGGATTTTDYCGNVVYENGAQKLLITEEGYITLSDNKYYYYLKDHQGNNRVVINQSGAVEETNHYYLFGGVFASSTSTQPYKYNSKEYDTKKGLNWYDYGARHYDAVLGRFMTVDPLAEKYYSESLYTYCYSNPINCIDPNGKDGIYIAFPDYKISTPIGKIGNLGHAGVLLIDNKTGVTKYYEYGRYDKEGKGVVRTFAVPNVKIGQDKKPTLESLNKTLSIISEQAGHAGRIEGAYIESDKFKEMKNYAESKIAENANSKRKEYSLRNNNCGTFAADVLKQDPSVKDKAPVIIDPRPNSIVKEYQDNFKSLNYDPKKRQVKIE